MAVSFDDIIERFLPSVKEYAYIGLDEYERNEILYSYIVAAAAKFRSACLEDLDDVDTNAGIFNSDLSDETIDILVDLVRVEWLKQKLYNSDLMRNGMSTKDYTIFSPANLHAQIRETYQDARKDAQNRLYQYSYTHPGVDIAGITV